MPNVIKDSNASSCSIDPSSLLSIAKETNHWVNKQIIYSPTRIASNQLKQTSRIAIRQALLDLRQHYAFDYAMLWESSAERDPFCYRAALSMAKKMIKYSIGACLEYAFLGVFYIAMRYPHLFAEIAYIKGGDHVFIVLARDPHSDPSDPLTWGQQAVICDPWAKQNYLANAFEKYLSSLICKTEQTQSGDFFVNRTIPFNDVIHSLEIETHYHSQSIQSSFSVSALPKDYPRASYLPYFFYPKSNSRKRITKIEDPRPATPLPNQN